MNERDTFVEKRRALPNARPARRALFRRESSECEPSHPSQGQRQALETVMRSEIFRNAAVNLLVVFADYLSMKGDQMMLATAPAEPPAIARARQYITEHSTEAISLGQTARAAQTSVCHFCKLFRKHTSLTFTEFVSRVRVEKAKRLLLNPNLRVSEIAFEVGFQSLTNFNRMFKRIVRRSPTDYRAQAPADPIHQ
jgi:AraC-like DNA-binding protein